MTGWPERVGILGAGALGTLIAHQVQSHTAATVWLWARPGHPGQVQVEGAPAVSVRLATPQLDSDRELDLVVVTVKAFDTAAAVASLQAWPSVGPGTLLLSLQNGLGNVELLAEWAGAERVLCGVTALGATWLGPGLVRAGGRGLTEVGALTNGSGGARARRVSDWLAGAGIPARPAADYRVPLWGKLAVNCAINPLTALLRVPNGDLLRRAESRHLMVAAAREAAAVARAEGVVLDRDPAEHALEVAAATAANRSSMLQDVERGRRTEVDAISGAVARLGSHHGAPTPVNRVLAALVRSLGPL